MQKNVLKTIDHDGKRWVEYQDLLEKTHTPFVVKTDSSRRIYTWEGEKRCFEISNDTSTTEFERFAGYRLFKAYEKTLLNGTAFNDKGRSFMENQAEQMRLNWLFGELPHLPNGRFNFTHNPRKIYSVRTALSLDLNAAYPHYLHSQGLMNDQIFELMMAAQKAPRLISIGMFNKIKYIRRFDGNEFEEVPESEYTSEQFGWIYQFARMGVLGRLEKVGHDLGADFIHSWVDAVVFRDCPKVLQKAEESVKYHFGTMPYKIEPIKTISYWSEGDGKRPKMTYYKQSKGAWSANLEDDKKEYLHNIDPRTMCNGSNISFQP